MEDFVIVAAVLGFTLSLIATIWLLRANYHLAAINADLSSDRALLHAACSEARAAFSRYAIIHQAKKTPEGDKKAHTNRMLAEAMDNALEDTEYQELGPMQEATRALRARLEEAFHG